MNIHQYMKENRVDTKLIQLRQLLHKNPDLSGDEGNTALIIGDFLRQYKPDKIITNVGGHGVIAEFKGKSKGPTVLFRCELDALPIEEKNTITYASVNAGKGHLCGHDGHMTMVAGLASSLQERPNKGRVLLLFQPSEETGKGAIQMIQDPVFKSYQPDYVFAIHNIPGYPLHQVVLSKSNFASSSCGMVIELKGKPSHAAEPEKGVNPANAIAKIILSINGLTENRTIFKDVVLVTPIHVRLGKLAYGTSPGDGILHFTLRSYRNDDMFRLKEMLEKTTESIASDEKLTLHISYEEEFPATVNNPECTDLVADVCKENGIDSILLNKPFRWSEDFGHFTERFSGSLFGLGSGLKQPALHNPDFDFPDELIITGTNLLKGIYTKLLNN